MACDVAQACQGRASAPTSLHLTLAFLGPLDAAQQTDAESVADRLTIAPFALSLDCVGGWAHNAIAWAGMTHAPGALLELAAGLHTGLHGQGRVLDPRPYHPHVTLARRTQRLPEAYAMAPLTWTCTEFMLVESRPEAAGGRYVPLARWPLRG